MHLFLPFLAGLVGVATADFLIYTFEDSNFTGELYVRRVLFLEPEFY